MDHRYRIDLAPERRFAGGMKNPGLDVLFGLEAASLAALREARLAATLDRVFAAHPYYRRRLAALGVSRGDLTSLSDIPRLPVTTKADYMARPGRLPAWRRGRSRRRRNGRLGHHVHDRFVRGADAVRFDGLRLHQHPGAQSQHAAAPRRDGRRLHPQPVPADQISARRVCPGPARGFVDEYSGCLRDAGPREPAPAGAEQRSGPGGGAGGTNAPDHPVGRALLHPPPGRARRGDGRAASGRAPRIRDRRRIRRRGAHRSDRTAQAARRALALDQRVVRRDRDARRDGRMRARFGLSQSGPGSISVRSRRPGHQTVPFRTAPKD